MSSTSDYDEMIEYICVLIILLGKVYATISKNHITMAILVTTDVQQRSQWIGLGPIMKFFVFLYIIISQPRLVFPNQHKCKSSYLIS